MRFAAMTPENATSEPTDKSMPPAMMTIAAPTDKTPNRAMLCNTIRPTFDWKNSCDGWAT